MTRNDKANHWQSGVLPYSWHKSGNTLWSGTDSHERFRRNGNPEYAGVEISYCINNEGFRTHSLVQHIDQRVNVALGCSFTFGVGLQLDNIWPSLVEKETDLPLINLGQGGGSSDTVARILTNVSTLFNIDTVYILWPPIHRFDLIHDWHIQPVLPNDSKVEHAWNLDDPNSVHRFNKNKLIVDLLAKLHNFSTVQYQVSDYYLIQSHLGDFARDNMHWGVKTQQHIANRFLNPNNDLDV